MDLLRREQLLSLTLRRSPYDYTKLYLCGFLAVPARKTILDFLVLHRCPRPAEVVHCTTSPGNEICVKLQFRNISDMLYTEYILLSHTYYLELTRPSSKVHRVKRVNSVKKSQLVPVDPSPPPFIRCPPVHTSSSRGSNFAVKLAILSLWANFFLLLHQIWQRL